MKVTIDRKTWYRGRGCGNSALLVTNAPGHEGEKCCLGFCALALGFTEADISGVPGPATLGGRVSLRSMTTQQRRFVHYLWKQTMDLNDRGQVDDREAMIRADLEMYGFEVEFVG